MARADIERIVNHLLLTKPTFTSGELASEAGISRQAVHRYLSDLVEAGRIVREGQGRGAKYRARDVEFKAHLERSGALDEDQIWDQARSHFPRLAELERASAILAHAFTEMLNNAIDHSESPTIDVSLAVDFEAGTARFTVTDQGVGAFENVRSKLGLESTLAALQEISKGKTSTQPEAHSGEGIFFTSKMGRCFEIEANGLRWTVDNERADQAISERAPRPGTTVHFETSLTTTLKLEELYAGYVHDDFGFDTSRVVIKLFEHGVRFVSRSEAKRLLAGLERFRHVILDFARVEGVGQGFADEVFRVWARRHPETHLRAENMVAPVAFMVERARRALPT